jgi:hypothetical protein
MKKCPMCKQEHTRKWPTCGARECVDKYAKHKANMRRHQTTPETALPMVSIRNKFLLRGAL